MLPYSPLHHLLSQDFDGPLVATSANLSGEPVLTEAAEVEKRLGHVADAYLHHDRPILFPADDSVRRVIAGKARLLRGGRGVAPLELALPGRVEQPLLAVGGHMKNTVALAFDDRVVISPHIGDLDSPRALAVFDCVVERLCELYQVKPTRILHDGHPHYASTRRARQWADEWKIPTLAIWHHHAHASALAGEFPRQTTPWLMFTWDGTGLGEDGTLWGGETLWGRPGAWQRVARLRPFFLPGGDQAGREPWRAAAALSWQIGGRWVPPLVVDVELARQAWQQGLNTHKTTAAGRVFDAAAALLGVCQRASFEGQGPMLLEQLAASVVADVRTPLPLIRTTDCLEIDWEPLLLELIDPQLAVVHRAARLHDRLAATITAVAVEIRAVRGPFAVGLTGGVWQNRRLAETACSHLIEHGFSVYLHERIPCSDGGLCYGQCIEAMG